jgi:hypothetical protein
MKQQLNLTQICIAAVAFLDKEYFTRYSDNLACCISDLALYRGAENWQEEPTTWDPAAWYDWLKVAGTTLGADVSKNTLVSPLQGYHIMRAFVYDYACRLNYADMKKLSATLDDANIELFQSSRLWKDWLLCVDAALYNKTEASGGLVSPETLITQQQCLEMMQEFLKDYCVKIEDVTNSAWFKHMWDLSFKNNNADQMLNDWLANYREYLGKQEETDRVDLRQALSIMFLFIKKQEESTSLEELKALSNILQINKDESSLDYSIVYGWYRAAYAVIYK